MRRASLYITAHQCVSDDHWLLGFLHAIFVHWLRLMLFRGTSKTTRTLLPLSVFPQQYLLPCEGHDRSLPPLVALLPFVQFPGVAVCSLLLCWRVYHVCLCFILHEGYCSGCAPIKFTGSIDKMPSLTCTINKCIVMSH